MKKYLYICLSFIVFLGGLSHSSADLQTPNSIIDVKDQRLFKLNNSGQDFLRSLDLQQLALAHFSMASEEREQWRYLPEPSRLTSLIFPQRRGLSMGLLSARQQALVFQMLDYALAQPGFDAVLAAREADKDDSIKFRGIVNSLLFRYGPANYFITIFGTPGASEWAFKFEGHHISLNFTVRGEKIIANPVFIGTNPAQIVIGENRKVSPLSEIRDLVGLFEKTLVQEQRKKAMSSLKKVPKLNLFAPGLFDKKLKFQKPSAGLDFSELSTEQVNLLRDVMTVYLSYFKYEDSSVLGSLLDSLNKSEIIWVGDKSIRGPFYFRIQSPVFILELMTSEDDFNHLHLAFIDNRHK